LFFDDFESGQKFTTERNCAIGQLCEAQILLDSGSSNHTLNVIARIGTATPAEPKSADVGAVYVPNLPTPLPADVYIRFRARIVGSMNPLGVRFFSLGQERVHLYQLFTAPSNDGNPTQSTLIVDEFLPAQDPAHQISSVGGFPAVAWTCVRVHVRAPTAPGIPYVETSFGAVIVGGKLRAALPSPLSIRLGGTATSERLEEQKILHEFDDLVISTSPVACP
jgi:hypothetical protein